MDPESPTLRIAVEQCSPALGSVASNRALIRAAITELSPRSDLIVFPELTLTGYDVRERAGEYAVPVDTLGLSALGLGDASASGGETGGTAAVFGFIERDSDGRIYNSAVAADSGGLLHRHRKCYLPTYGMFEEGRYFAPGRSAPRAFALGGGWRAGLLICEDFWHPALTYLLALERIDVLIVTSAVPGREPRDAPDGTVSWGSSRRWELLLRAAALNHQIYVVFANRVGGEGDIEFAGGSLIVGPDGEILAKAKEGAPGRLESTLGREALVQAREPFSHLRDESPSLTYFGLGRILTEEQG